MSNRMPLFIAASLVLSIVLMVVWASLRHGGMSEPCNSDGSCRGALKCQMVPAVGFQCGTPP